MGIRLEYKNTLRHFSPQRGGYDQLVSVPEAILNAWRELYEVLVKRGSIEAEYCTWDSKKRGQSLNYDLYSAGLSERKPAFIVQARQAWRRAARHYLGIRKTYALAGWNENGTPFWHPVPSAVIRSAIRRQVDPIAAARAWMFKVDVEQLAHIVRQGDVALVPVKRARGEAIGSRLALGPDLSHQLDAKEIRMNEAVYALDPQLVHVKAQHKAVHRLSGWFRVVHADTARAWDFAPRSVD